MVFLRAIKIRSTSSFGGEVKPSVHVVRFYGMLKIPADYVGKTSPSKRTEISRQLSASLLGVSATTRRLWWMNHKLLELRWGRTINKNYRSAWDTL
jgi:hypothetical protein